MAAFMFGSTLDIIPSLWVAAPSSLVFLLIFACADISYLLLNLLIATDF